jgi:beta-lactamase regulating signal transducer with metallopeptidase domain
MAEAKGVLKGVVYVILGLIAIGIVGWIAYELIQHLPSALKRIGSTATQTPIGDSGIFGPIIKVVLGAVPPVTYESLILLIAIFVIILFGLAEIIETVSTFSSTTAWVIAFGLAIIAGVTKVISYIAGIFAITSGIGAIGIAIIIIMAIVMAVIMNFLIGRAGIRNAMEAEKDQDRVNTAARKMRKGYGLLKAGSEIVDDEA